MLNDGANACGGALPATFADIAMVGSPQPPAKSKRTAKKQVSIENPKDFSMKFANAVTRSSENNMDWVAKNGEESLFRTLQRMFPEIAQPEDGRHRLKGKISGPEFNKLLQNKCQFQCARTRKKNLAETAGNWLFCNRRWLNPLKREDRLALEQGYEDLCASYPAFASCTKSEFMQFLMDVCISWSDRIGESSPTISYPKLMTSRTATSNHASSIWTAPSASSVPDFPRTGSSSAGFSRTGSSSAGFSRTASSGFSRTASSGFSRTGSSSSSASTIPEFNRTASSTSTCSTRRQDRYAGGMTSGVYYPQDLPYAAHQHHVFDTACPTTDENSSSNYSDHRAAAVSAGNKHPLSPPLPYEQHLSPSSSSPLPLCQPFSSHKRLCTANRDRHLVQASHDLPPEESPAAGWRLNAGQTVDATLHEHWACVPSLRVEASELEQFARSKSF